MTTSDGGKQSRLNPANALLSLGSMLFITVSLSTFIIKSIVFSGWSSDSLSITPLRWAVSTLVPVLVVKWGHRKKSLSTSGAFFALIVGFVLTLANFSFFLCLLVFFISSSKITKFKSEVKRSFEAEFKEGGQRNWVQVLCNGGMALELSLLYLLDVGSADLPVDFSRHYRSSWLGVAVLGALACCNGDTWASELGSVLGSAQPRLITTLRRVPRGTNGGVTLIGLGASLVGGLVIGLAYYVGIVMTAPQSDVSRAPNQLFLLLLGSLGGLLGSIIDSVLGASLQFSGRDVKSGKIVEVVREGVIPISGQPYLDNHSVNLLSSILTALILPKLALGLGI